MKIHFRPVSNAVLAVLLCSCAGTSLKQTWKSPDYTGGPVQKVAVLAVDERAMVREALEVRYAAQLKQQGEGAMTTYGILSLPEIKENKEAAATRLRQAGADAILIVRLVDTATYASQLRTVPIGFQSTVVGFNTYGWYDYYSVAYMGLGSSWNSMSQDVYLDNSLYDLKTSKRLWSGLTETVLRDDTDRLAAINPLVKKVLTALRKDGFVR